MASFKEDERFKKDEVLQANELIEDIAMQATIGIEKNYQSKAGAGFDPTELGGSLVDVDNLPNFITGLPEHYIPINLPSYEDDDEIDE
jgi:hypothetical protein